MAKEYLLLIEVILMIKRDGVAVMNERTGNVSIAKETIKVCKDKQYTAPSGNVVDFSSSLDAALQGTKLYVPSEVIETKTIFKIPKIEVVNETTSQAAVRLLKTTNKVVALNFASARNQGGGFLSGAIAQEEDLCRASGLYPCLKSKPIFYNENILCDDCYYTDHIIYSPDVPFFRDDDNKFLETTYNLSIISAPAPNLRSAKDVDEDKVVDTIFNRCKRILEIAGQHGHDTIILGAWGCGAFGNDPALVATCFAEALKDVPVFSYVCFAVYDTRTPPHLFETFNQVFS